MLKIILGVENADKYIDNLDLVIDFPNEFFNQFKKAEWFKTDFARKVIKDIDKAEIEKDFSIVSDVTHKGYSVDNLSGGSKSLLLMYNRPNNIVLAKMGDNCTKYVEWIASEFEKQGRDLIIISNIIHVYNFEYVKEIYFYNYDMLCRSWKDVIAGPNYLWSKEG